MKNKISVIGLGPVGYTTAIGFSKLGFNVVGVDILKERVNKINELKNKRLKATTDLREAILNTDISFVCVGTPTMKNKDIDISYLEKASKNIGKIIKNSFGHIIVFRSTMFPGSMDMLRGVLEKSSGRKEGKDFFLAINPEFLREKTAMEDFFKPSFIVVGSRNIKISYEVMSYYKKINARKFVVGERIAQMIKYANNSYHALKVAFTNELAAICKEIKVDSKPLMELFCQDTKLNISPSYFKPGRAYGGRCLPKDLVVLQKKSRDLKIKSPIIESISKSNEIQEKRDRKRNA